MYCGAMPCKSTLLPVSRKGSVCESRAFARSDSLKGAVYWLFLGVTLGRAEHGDAWGRVLSFRLKRSDELCFLLDTVGSTQYGDHIAPG